VEGLGFVSYPDTTKKDIFRALHEIVKEDILAELKKVDGEIERAKKSIVYLEKDLRE
jgi:hypothetical protein